MTKVYQNQRGAAALLITITILLMLTIGALMTMHTAQTDMDLSFNQVHADQAFYIAEAGIKRANMELRQNPTWKAGFSSVAFATGTYSVSVIDSSSNPALIDTILLQATANVYGATANIDAWLVPEWSCPFQMGAFGDNGVDFAGQLIDSYDSDSGTYASQAVNGPDGGGNMYASENGSLSSNGIIKLSGASVHVHGDVTTSVPGGLTIGSATVYGDTSSVMPAVVLDSIPAADIADAEANNDAPTNLTFVGNASYDPFTKELRSSGGTVIFGSGTYYFSSVDLTANSTLEIAPGAKIKIYVTGYWDTNGASMANPDGIPGNVQIFCTGTSFGFYGGSSFWAAVYAPDAVITVTGGGEAYGSYIGGQIKNGGGTCFHYDEALGRVKTGVVTGYKLVAWREY